MRGNELRADPPLRCKVCGNPIDGVNCYEDYSHEIPMRVCASVEPGKAYLVKSGIESPN